MNLFYLTQDINFQKALLLVAIIALILAILVSAYKLNVVAIAGQSWPPIVAPCPDYWDLSGAYCINTTNQNYGNIGYTNATATTLYSGIPSQYENTYAIPLSTMKIDKKKWASLNGFVWDGLTSG